MGNLIAAVIPYYQKEEGILHRSVLSALHQRDVEAFPIVIVDDGSPLSPRFELADLITAYPDRIKIITQSNAGPGAARNTGLDALSSDTDFVAFLDSDDTWTERHLSNALRGLGPDRDFYFSDYRHEQGMMTAYEMYGFNVTNHKPMGDPSLFAYVGDLFDALAARPTFFGTSTVVYRIRRHPGLRFDTRFRFACEDVLFWLALARRTRKIGFSGIPEVIRGRGVSIYQSGAWMTDNAIDLLHDEINFHRYLLANFPLTESQRSRAKAAIPPLRRHLIRNFIHRVGHRKPIKVATLVDCILKEPVILASIAPVGVSAMRDRLLAFLKGR